MKRLMYKLRRKKYLKISSSENMNDGETFNREYGKVRRLNKMTTGIPFVPD